MGGETNGLTRRALLRDGSAAAAAVFVAGGAGGLGSLAVAAPARGKGFLTEAELEALRALVDEFIPVDTDPGAVAAHCAEAIDALLAAFKSDPPRIYAGAPFSDRAGSPVNHFKRFLPLDSYEEKAWRLRIQGSRGKPELEFNGPVKGFQQIYREGLAPDADDAAVEDLVDIAFVHTYEFMYGAPEYGGNRDLVGWEYTNYAGDVHPRGWTRKEIEELDSDGGIVLPLADPAHVAEAMPLAPLAAGETMHFVMARSEGRVSRLRAEIAPVVEWAKGRRDGG
jgi:hypothetical protein